MSVKYKLEIFEGPLDLLLHLIDKNEIDIHDIPIAQITEQYMEYVQTMQQLELEVTSEFLVMAATLLSIKSKLLLPKPPKIELEGFEEDEIDPREELVMKLIEYRKYKSMAEQLREMEVARSLIYSREPQDLSPFLPETTDNPLKGVHLADLMLAFQRTLKRLTSRNRVARIRRDEISVKDRITEIVRLLEASREPVLFSSLFAGDRVREEMVVTFLAILELMKMKQINCQQSGLFDDIMIQYKGEGVGNEISADEINY